MYNTLVEDQMLLGPFPFFLEKKEWLYYFVRQRGNTVG